MDFLSNTSSIKKMNQPERKMHVLQTIAPREKQIKSNGNAIIEFKKGLLYLICDAPAQKQQISADLIRKTIESFKEYFEGQEYPDLQKALLNAVVYANKMLLADAPNNPGVSLAAALVSEQLLYYVGAGDCQIVLMQKGKIKPLTISSENLEALNLAGESDFLGQKREIKVSVSAHPVALKKEDIILIATGSFFKKTMSDRLSEILTNPDTHINHKALDISEHAASSTNIDQATYFLLQGEKQGDNEKAPSFFNRYIVTSFLLAAIFVTAVYISDKFFTEPETAINSLLEKELNETEMPDTLNYTSEPMEVTEDHSVPDTDLPTQKPANSKQVILKDTTINHIVKKGETLYRIALRYHISVGEIENLNKVKAASVQLGQKILIPVKGVYTAQQKTNLVELSKLCGVPVENLLKANLIEDELENIAGKSIILPK